MFEAEATWLDALLRHWAPERLSPLLNIGSSTRRFREIEQPWTEARLFLPLRQRGVTLIHLDLKEGEGVDIRADILSDADLPKVIDMHPKAILCCNILEHVLDPAALARRCQQIVGPGGLIFVTVPLSYPHHRDPIDTMYRPDLPELVALFQPAIMVKGDVVAVGPSYRQQVLHRPWLLLRNLLRVLFPFIGFTGWKRSMAKLYWLTHDFQVTAAAFEVRPPVESGNPDPYR
jgi:hypothetical protein